VGAASVGELLARAQGLVKREDLSRAAVSQITENTKGPGVVKTWANPNLGEAWPHVDPVLLESGAQDLARPRTVTFWKSSAVGKTEDPPQMSASRIH